jgi:hypothetical protein
VSLEVLSSSHKSVILSEAFFIPQNKSVILSKAQRSRRTCGFFELAISFLVADTLRTRPSGKNRTIGKNKLTAYSSMAVSSRLLPFSPAKPCHTIRLDRCHPLLSVKPFATNRQKCKGNSQDALTPGGRHFVGSWTLRVNNPWDPANSNVRVDQRWAAGRSCCETVLRLASRSLERLATRRADTGSADCDRDRP